MEIHAANGYLIDEFLQSKTNHRTDEYGGSVENRYRFLKEVIEAVTSVWPAHRVGVHLSPNGPYNDMGSPDYREQFTFVAGQLDRFGLAYLHVVDGLAFGFHNLGEPMTLAEFRKVFHGPLVGNCGYTKETAEQAIAAGDADLISFGRPFISNPEPAKPRKLRIARRLGSVTLAPSRLLHAGLVADCSQAGIGYTEAISSKNPYPVADCSQARAKSSNSPQLLQVP